VLRGGWRASVARDEIKDGRDASKDSMLFGERTTFGERDPCALIFAITTLNLLMDTFLHFSF
jgi:hypothetical protein